MFFRRRGSFQPSRPKRALLSCEALELRLSPAVMHTNFIRYEPANHIVPAQGSGTPSGMTPAMLRHAYGADVTTFGSGPPLSGAPTLRGEAPVLGEPTW